MFEEHTVSFGHCANDYFGGVQSFNIRVGGMALLTWYLCEASFLSVAVLKSKHQVEINIKQKVMMTNLHPRFEKSCSTQYAHNFHWEITVLCLFWWNVSWESIVVGNGRRKLEELTSFWLTFISSLLWSSLNLLGLIFVNYEGMGIPLKSKKYDFN